VELRHLRYFAVVAQELHFGRAAERLHVAQPAVSQQIQRLEHELGVQLLERTSKHVRLTPEGAQLLEHAQRILSDADSLERLAGKVSRGQAGELRLGVVSVATFSYLPQALRKFVQEADGVDVAVQVLDTPEQVDALVEDRLDVGLLRPWGHNKDLSIVNLHNERMILAISSAHPLAHRRQVSIGEFSDDPFLTYRRDRGEGYYDLVVGICRASGFYPRIVHELDEIYTITAMVAAGFGVALVPHAVALLKIPGVKYVPLKDPAASIGLAVAWSSCRVSPVAERFIKVAQQISDTRR